MSGTQGGNQHLLFLLGVSALGSVEELQVYWSLQRRHPDGGERWLDLAHYATRDDAQQALDRVVEHRHAEPGELRVHHVTRSGT